MKTPNYNVTGLNVDVGGVLDAKAKRKRKEEEEEEEERKRKKKEKDAELKASRTALGLKTPPSITTY